MTSPELSDTKNKTIEQQKNGKATSINSDSNSLLFQPKCSKLKIQCDIIMQTKKPHFVQENSETTIRSTSQL